MEGRLEDFRDSKLRTTGSRHLQFICYRPLVCNSYCHIRVPRPSPVLAFFAGFGKGPRGVLCQLDVFGLAISLNNDYYSKIAFLTEPKRLNHEEIPNDSFFRRCLFSGAGSNEYACMG
jgi:hypothetical protein